MSVEHVMPQTWTSTWPLLDGRFSPPDKLTGSDQSMLDSIRAREQALHTLGNLTLITVPANTTASNKAFLNKKAWLKQSLLALNLAILEHEAWDEVTISQRADDLANLAATVWPGLDVT